MIYEMKVPCVYVAFIADRPVGLFVDNDPLARQIFDSLDQLLRHRRPL